MHSLLSPGIRLLGRFGFARKFQILFLLFMLPLAGSLWLIGQDYRAKLAVISSEQSGVRQLLALDALDGQLTAQRNLAARWKAADILHAPTPAAKAAMDKVDANYPQLLQSLQTLGESLKAQHASADILARFEALQATIKGMDSQSLRTVGWWPDGYDRFTAALTAMQTLREQVTLDTGLILDPWLETYLLMQISTQHTPDLIERVGRMASVGQSSIASGQFTLQSRLQMRDLRGRIGDARDQLVKAAASLKAKQYAGMEAWTAQYDNSLQTLDNQLKVLDDGVFGGTIKLDPAVEQPRRLAHLPRQHRHAMPIAQQRAHQALDGGAAGDLARQPRRADQQAGGVDRRRRAQARADGVGFGDRLLRHTAARRRRGIDGTRWSAGYVHVRPVPRIVEAGAHEAKY